MGRRSTVRRWSGFSRDVLRSGTVLALVLTAGVARAQTLPPGALEQLDHLVGSRVETFAVLDTQSGASGGTYTSKLNDTDLAITRVTGRGDVAEKRPLGDSGILWSPVLEGGVGYGTFENNFGTGALVGNQSTVDSLAVFLGGGVRFTVWEHLSLAPTFGVIYAHTENDFDARNDAGRELLRLAGSDAVNDLVNWSADTFTLVPGIELRYRRLFGTIQLTLTSRFKYFHTEPIERSTSALSFESTSQWWFNEVDVEWRMPLYLWGRQLRTGGYFARSELFGGLEDSFGTSYFYQSGGRLVMDVQGLLWKLEYVGIGAGYFWSDQFSGWTIGAEISFAFSRYDFAARDFNVVVGHRQPMERIPVPRGDRGLLDGLSAEFISSAAGRPAAGRPRTGPAPRADPPMVRRSERALPLRRLRALGLGGARSSPAASSPARAGRA